jgi:hypothetical protein
MSVNVDFDIRVRGFGANKKSAVKAVADFLADDGLDNDLEKTDGKEEVRFASDLPVIISKSYVYLPELEKRLGALAKAGGFVIELRTRVDSDDDQLWSTTIMPKRRRRGRRRSCPSTARRW